MNEKMQDAKKISDLAQFIDTIVKDSQAEIAASYSPLGYVRKGKRMHKILAIGGGQVVRVCARPCCQKLERYARYRLLPCNHHGLITFCNCPVRDRHCRTCRQVFIAVREHWYRIVDPHATQPAQEVEA